MLRLALRLDVDRDDQAFHFLLQRRLDPVADVVRQRYGHVAGHDKMELDEGHLAGPARFHVMRLDRAFGIR